MGCKSSVVYATMNIRKINFVLAILQNGLVYKTHINRHIFLYMFLMYYNYK